MILVIRISGNVDISSDVGEALKRLRLRRKYAAVLVRPSAENVALLRRIRDFVAYGTITKETLKELLKRRGKPLKAGERMNYEHIIERLDKNTLSELGVRPFFSLHPPRGGIESKKHYGVGKGVLGDNKEKINDLVRRML